MPSESSIILIVGGKKCNSNIVFVDHSILLTDIHKNWAVKAGLLPSLSYAPNSQLHQECAWNSFSSIPTGPAEQGKPERLDVTATTTQQHLPVTNTVYIQDHITAAFILPITRIHKQMRCTKVVHWSYKKVQQLINYFLKSVNTVLYKPLGILGNILILYVLFNHYLCTPNIHWKPVTKNNCSFFYLFNSYQLL